MSAESRLRADELMVAQRLCETRSQARLLIKAGRVSVDGGELLQKPSQSFSRDVALRISGEAPFVSRGGEKLSAALDAFALYVNRVRALDAGASTGGFTDCLLRRGAAGVTCVDVGHGQLHPRLANDERVTNYEGLNIRALAGERLPQETYDLVVADLSFISLRLVLEPLWQRVARGGHLVTLVKPQFEAGAEAAAKNAGIIRDPAARQAALAAVLSFVEAKFPSAALVGTMESPIRGGDGNIEFLSAWKREA